MLIRILVSLVLIMAVSSDANGYAAIAKRASSISKGHGDGSVVTLSCESKKPTLCAVKVTIKKKNKTLKIDFSKFNVTPNLDILNLYGSSVDSFSIKTSVSCVEGDNAYMPKGVVAEECFIEVNFEDNEIGIGDFELRSYGEITTGRLEGRK